MLFVWQLPLTDARLLAAGSARVRAPDWPTPRLASDFVRGFGPVLRRRRGGHEEFADEGVYAAAGHALRFDDLRKHPLALGERAIVPTVVFRRLLCSDRRVGGVCTRVEVGLDTSGRHTPAPAPLAGRDWIKAALQMAEVPVRVRVLDAEGPLESTLWSSGPQLAKAYVSATSPKTAAATAPLAAGAGRPVRLVIAGAPLAFIEYGPGDAASLPAGARAIAPERVGGLHLHFLWLEYRRREFGLWFLRRDPGTDALARRLRVGLLRLHAEHQALRDVLTLLLGGDLTYIRGTPEADLLDKYLNYAVRLLGRDQHGGFSHAALQEVIAAYQTVVDADQLKLLAERLDDARRQVSARVLAYSQAAALPPQAAALPQPAVEKGDAVRVFVSYSHRDAKYLKEGSLVDYVSGGLREERFDFWYDTNLRGADLWDEEIRKELDRADIALVLVSQWFLNSRYITDVEATAFIEGMRARGLRVYPIILRQCDWKTKAWLAKTQSQPRDGKTLEDNYKTRAAREALFLTVLEDLRAIGGQVRTARPS